MTSKSNPRTAGKILCLPGFLQSGKTFADKTSGIRTTLSKLNFQLDYLDPLNVIPDADRVPFLRRQRGDEKYQFFDKIVSRGNNRSWWEDIPYEPKRFEGSISYVINYIKENGPYVGILAFSQGACLAAIITNKIHELLPEHPHFRIAFIISGFALTQYIAPKTPQSRSSKSIGDLEEYRALIRVSPALKEFYELPRDGLPTKMVFVWGNDDSVVPKVRTQYLASLYDPKQVKAFVHEGSHYIPKDPEFLDGISEYVQQVFRDELIISSNL
ncbi:serine hydrolase FSH [Scheffersomyces xylosifermentans]|uniref:serine hydrolase FSH n=1 Tax=Scheffersomyces xylosifermentans TaxID=1304137 RepID=UPI00315CF5B7